VSDETWGLQSELNFVQRLGSHAPRHREIVQQNKRDWTQRCLRGYLEALKTTDRWGGDAEKIGELRTTASSRLERLEAQK